VRDPGGEHQAVLGGEARLVEKHRTGDQEHPEAARAGCG
jgi:hypothetical protein